LQADRSNKPLSPAKVKPVKDAARVTGKSPEEYDFIHVPKL